MTNAPGRMIANYEVWRCQRGERYKGGRKLEKRSFVGYANDREEARILMDGAFVDGDGGPVAVYGDGLEMLRERRDGTSG